MTTDSKVAPVQAAGGISLSGLMRECRIFVATQPLGAVSFLYIALLIASGVFAGQLAPYDPVALDFGAMLSPPSPQHWFGTDQVGRDILSRLIHGARTAIMISFIASVGGATIGAVIGVASAYFGGWFDLLVQRVIEIMLAIPLIVLAMVIAAVLGKNMVFGLDVNLIFAITVPIIPKVARVVRSSALTVGRMAYVDAARTAGFKSSRIILVHMLPNVMAPYLIMMTAFIGQCILLEASLSFLGLGVTEPTPAWGLMLSGSAAEFYRQAPWIIIFPGLAISLSVFAFNLFGDSLREWLDPRLRT